MDKKMYFNFRYYQLVHRKLYRQTFHEVFYMNRINLFGLSLNKHYHVMDWHPIPGGVAFTYF